jgi:TPR repeat protein
VPKHQAQAQLLIERAVTLGARQALAGMAWCAIEGCATIPDPAKAGQWTTPLRAVNRPLSLYLEWLAQDRLTPLRTATLDLQTSDREPALTAPKLLRSAAQAGNIHALIELGLNAVAAQQPGKALKYFQQAAGDSDVAAANAAIVAQGMRPQAVAESDASKIPLELLTQAQRFHRGDGVSVNYSEAIRLYRLAAAKGSTEAERMLALIYSRPLVNGGVDIAWISQLSALDLSRTTPSLRVKTSPRQLQRERSALIDLLPAKWRARIL